jgi:hypothetical protein
MARLLAEIRTNGEEMREEMKTNQAKMDVSLERMEAKIYTTQENIEARIDTNQEKMIAKTDTSLREMKAEIRASNEKFEVLQSTLVSWMDIYQAWTEASKEEMMSKLATSYKGVCEEKTWLVKTQQTEKT